jgi:Predicted permease
LHDFVDIMAFLILGAVLAAGGKLIIKESNVQDFLQQTPAVAVLLMMGIAILFCLCSEADAFVAANFPLFWPDGSKLAFLVLGPMLDFKLLLMYTRVYRARLIGTIVIALVVQVFTYSLIVEYFFGTVHPPEQKKIDMPPNVQTYLLSTGIGPDPLGQLVHFGAAFRRSGKGEPLGYKQLYDSAELSDQRSFFKDQIVTVLGQYDPRGNDHIFMLARLRILCCRNDMTELFIPVFSREAIRDYTRGTWVKVTGRIEYHQQANGTYYPVLMVAEAADVIKGSPDLDPYVK